MAHYKSKEVYTVVIRSSDVTVAPNRGTAVDGTYYINWADILPKKYKRFRVKANWQTESDNTISITNYFIYSSLIQNNGYSYETRTRGRSGLLCIANLEGFYDNDPADPDMVCNFRSTPDKMEPIMINYPPENYITISVRFLNYNVAGSIDPWVLVLSFEPCDQD